MIHNVFGKAVTKSTLMRLPEYEGKSEFSREEMGWVALMLKNSQGKNDKDEAEGLRFVERLRDQCTREEIGFTLGWIYNATGAPLRLVDSRDWYGELASSSLYPVRIENGQWGVFLHKHGRSRNTQSSGVVVYEGLNFGESCYWCVAWNNESRSSFVQVYVKMVKGSTWNEFEWGSVQQAIQMSQRSVHKAKKDEWVSVISASPSPQVVFEALLTIEHL